MDLQLNTFDAIISRLAIKQFDPDYKMSSDEIKFLMELAILSPTSYNQQNWRFITVSDQKLKEEISKAARNQPQPSDGSLIIILCGDTNAWMKSPNRYWKNYPLEK